jgi:mono/diheme cytochrome c family protein
MHSLDGEKSYLKGLKKLADITKAVFGKNSPEHKKVLQQIKEQKAVIKRWQSKVNAGEEKPYAPDYSGTLRDQIQAIAAYVKEKIDAMPDWWEHNDKEK